MTSTTKCFPVVAFALLSWCLLSSEAATAKPGEVLELDADNFAAAIKQHAFIAVEFFAPWCGHCKRLEPEWAKAAVILASHSNDPAIVLAKLDATDEKNTNLAKEHDIKGFPTIKIFRDGAAKGQDYSGSRIADGIVANLEKLAGPATTALTTAEEVKTFVEKDPVVMLAVFKKGAEELQVYESVARDMRGSGSSSGLEVNFGYVQDDGLLPGVEKSNKFPAIYMYKKFDERVVQFETALTEDNLKLFVNSRSLPLVAELDKKPESRNILRRLFEYRAPKVIAFVDYKNDQERGEIKAALSEVAGKGELDFKFVIGDSTENEGAIKFFGVSPDLLPAVVLHDTEADKKYVLQEARASEISSWLTKYSSGSLEASIKSEEVPKTNLGSVKVVVAKSFEELVTGSKTDVLIELYAPWCGHCKKLAPIYEKVGEAFSSDASITIAKMDATANDVPDARFIVKGFPSLYFYKAEADKVIPYTGDRSESDLIKFVKMHARKTRDEL